MSKLQNFWVGRGCTPLVHTVSVRVWERGKRLCVMGQIRFFYYSRSDPRLSQYLVYSSGMFGAAQSKHISVVSGLTHLLMDTHFAEILVFQFVAVVSITLQVQYQIFSHVNCTCRCALTARSDVRAIDNSLPVLFRSAWCGRTAPYDVLFAVRCTYTLC